MTLDFIEMCAVAVFAFAGLSLVEIYTGRVSRALVGGLALVMHCGLGLAERVERDSGGMR